MRADDGVNSQRPTAQQAGGGRAQQGQSLWLGEIVQVAPPPPPDGVLRTDRGGVIHEADEPAARLFHSDRAFLIGKPLGLLLARESRKPFYDFLTGARLPGDTQAFELRLARAGAPARDVVVVAEKELAPSGAAPTFRWLLRDVSATRRIEQALRAERHLLDSVIDAVQAIILVLDTQGRVLRSNRYLHEVCGYSRDQLQLRYWDEVLVLPDDRRRAQRLFREALQRGAAHEGDALPLPACASGPRSVVWSARGLPEGVAGSVVLLGNDVTELQEAQAQALRAERLATIGLVTAGLAHESRNALQRIQACLSMLTLRLEGQQSQVMDLIGRAQQAQDDLSRLFDDVLGYAAAPRLVRAACDLATVWRAAWADVEPARQGRDAELVEEAVGTDLTCEVDAFQMKRVFCNLFENSLAARDGGLRIVVGCRATGLGGRPTLRVSVRDNGPGLAPEVRHRLFEPFYTTRTKGTGLGLAICQRIVEAHGGRIEASERGPGAEFVITLPRRIP